METEGLSDTKTGRERYRSGMMETWYKNTFSYGSPPVAASVIALNDVSGVFYKDEASQVMPAKKLCSGRVA